MKAHQESFERYVAYFDFLGFRSWIRTKGSKEVYERVVFLLGLAVKGSLPGASVGSDMSVRLRRSRVHYSNFSDTVVFYTTDCSYASLDALIWTCTSFMVQAISIQMVRGAISRGVFRVFREDNIHVGEALLDAHDLAESQDWVGLAVHSGMHDDTNTKRFRAKNPKCLVSYPIPLKTGVYNGYCVNWVDKSISGWSFFPADQMEECRERALASAAGQPIEIEKIERRIKNTCTFLTTMAPVEMSRTMPVRSGEIRDQDGVTPEWH